MQNSDKILRLGNAGMRGMVGQGLDLSSVADFASAFATLMGGDCSVLLARDNRKSSKMLYDCVMSSLLSMGLEVIDGGVLSAGLVHYVIGHGNYRGGMLISAGHQKANWNSIIPLNSNGEYFNNIELRELYDIYHSKMFTYATIDGIKRVKTLLAAEIDSYFEYLGKFFDVELIKKAKLRVICDFCDGTGSFWVDRWQKLLQIELIKVNANAESNELPRNPEPNSSTGSFISSVIQELKCDIGFVFNTDMSRMSMVSENGVSLSEEMTFPLALDYILTKDQSISHVISNICSTKTIDEVVKKHNRKIEKTSVGQSNIIEKMHLFNCYLGGEGSGTFAYGKEIVGFDGFFMATMILEYLASSQEKLSNLASKLPKFYMEKMTIESSKLHSYSKLRAFKHIFHNCQISELDGIRFDFEDGFISIRVSGTEKIIRLISESNNSKLASERIWFAKNKLEF